MVKRTEARRPAYVDTSALIAFLDRSDTHHPLFRRLFSDPPRLVTSALVVAEGHGWFLRRYDGTRALQLLDFVHSLSMLEIKLLSSSEISKSKHVLQAYADQKLTLADAHGLSIMSDERIRVCWSTDRHLGLSGVPLIL
jgi:predicted nucleic acid-binding protein